VPVFAVVLDLDDDDAQLMHETSTHASVEEALRTTVS